MLTLTKPVQSLTQFRFSYLPMLTNHGLDLQNIVTARSSFLLHCKQYFAIEFRPKYCGYNQRESSIWFWFYSQSDVYIRLTAVDQLNFRLLMRTYWPDAPSRLPLITRVTLHSHSPPTTFSSFIDYTCHYETVVCIL